MVGAVGFEPTTR